MTKSNETQKQDTPPVITEAELKKIIDRMTKREANIAEAKAHVECAKVPLLNLNEKLKKLEDEQAADRALVNSWILANPDKLGPKNTLDMAKAVLSLHAKSASIKNLDGVSDEDVIAACEKAGKTQYVSTQKEFNRSIVNTDWKKQRISERELKKLGLFADTAPVPRVKLKKI